MSEYEDHDYHGEDLEDEDWDTEGTKDFYENLGKSAGKVIQDKTLERIEESLSKNEDKYVSKGYRKPMEYYPKNGETISERLQKAEKRIELLTQWLFEQGYKPKVCPYGDQYKEKKAELGERLAEDLSETYPMQWEKLSVEGRKKWVSDVLFREGMKSKEKLGILEKEMLSRYYPIMKEFDDAYKRRKCHLCGLLFDDSTSWTDFLEHMGKVHRDSLEEFYWSVSMLEPTRYHKASEPSKERLSEEDKGLAHQGTLLKSRKERLKDQNS